MAQPNYSFAKRQRDLAKQAKKEEKRLKKLAARQQQASQTAEPAAPRTAESPGPVS